MLVSAKEMLDKAKAGHYAVGQFNINNLEWTKSVLLTAEELRSPVILGVSEGAGKYMTGFGTVAAMVKAMHDELGITVPVALHLDHGTYEGCYKCIKAGFTSIMFDGSHYPIDENVEKTKELVSVAHAMGMSIEAEVGSIGGEEDGVVGMGECADPEECKKIADLGVTMAAYEGMSDGWVNSVDCFNLQPYMDAMDNIVFRPHTNATLAWWNPMCEELKKPWNDEESMDDACKNIVTIMNDAIAEESY